MATFRPLPLPDLTFPAFEAHLLNRHTVVFRDMPAMSKRAANEAIEGFEKSNHDHLLCGEYSIQG